MADGSAPFDLDRMLESARTSPTPDPATASPAAAPAPTTDTPPAGDHPPTPDPTAAPPAATPPSPGPATETPAPGGDAPTAPGTETETPPSDDPLALHKPVLDAVERIGGVEELDLLHSIAAPLVAPELDPPGFFKAFEEQRGTVAYDQLAWALYDRHADDFGATYIAVALGDRELARDPDRLKTVLREFGEYRRSGGKPVSSPAPPQPGAPAPSSTAPRASGTAATLPAIDVEDYDLAAPVREFVIAAQALLPEIDQLRNDVQDLKGHRAREAQRIVDEARQRQESAAAAQVNKLTGEIGNAIAEVIGVVAFSTATDPQARTAEDEQTKKDIRLNVIHDLDQDPAFGEIYQRAKEKYLAGDLVGARTLVQSLRSKAKEKAQHYATSKNGRLQAHIAANAPPVTKGPTIVSGAGTAPTPLAPVPTGAPAGGAFDMNRMLERAKSLP
jgi:hypothetical protein